MRISRHQPIESRKDHQSVVCRITYIPVVAKGPLFSEASILIAAHRLIAACTGSTCSLNPPMANRASQQLPKAKPDILDPALMPETLCPNP